MAGRRPTGTECARRAALTGPWTSGNGAAIVARLPQVLAMPILPREADIYPDNLLETDSPFAASGSWWAMYTLARREKALMRQLRALEIPHYGPLIKRTVRSPAGRRRDSYVPLFAGYVFVCGGEQQRYQSLTTNCVSRCIPVADVPRLLHDLRQIRRLVETGAPLTVEARIEPGQRVRVRSGPMMGLEGTVAKRRGRDYLVVEVAFLQQGASVLLEDFQVEPV